MSLFLPMLMIGKMTDITPQSMKNIGVQTLLLDIDNTMTTHDNPVPAEGVEKWIEMMKASGFSLIIVSNNDEERVKPFADRLGLQFESKGKKPLSLGFSRACKRLGVSAKSTAVVGDQIFTDILGGNLLGAYTILTEPYQMEKGSFFKLKRILEKPILRACRRRDRKRAKKIARIEGKAEKTVQAGVNKAANRVKSPSTDQV